MAPIGKTGEMDGEVDEAAWVPIGEALGRLTHKSDQETLKRVTQIGEPG
jgi:hypothetical protein